MAKKANKAEINKREQVILEALHKGMPLKDICKKLSSKWSISKAQVHNYYKNAIKKNKKRGPLRLIKKRISQKTLHERNAEMAESILQKMSLKEIQKIYSSKWKVTRVQVRNYYYSVLEKEMGIDVEKIKKKQADPLEVIEREITIIEAIAQGLPLKDILKSYSKEWMISTRQVEEYYYRVLKKFRDKYEKEKDIAVAKLRLKYDHLYGKCIKANDRAIARQILNDEGKMAGAFIKEKEEETNLGVTSITVKPPKLD